MARETVLITGASSGIGRELARLFAADGATPILVARRVDRLEELAGELRANHGVEPLVVPADLVRPAAPDDIVRQLRAQSVEVDVLVNNAGFGARGAVAELPLERQLDMVQVNVTALVHLTRLLLPGMLRRGRGGVLNVGSTAGFQPGPYLTVYYATKAFVLSLSEGLAEEVRGTGVRVCCLAPGPTRTGWAAEADMQQSRLFSFGAMSADQVARAGYRGFRAGRTLVVPGLRNQVGTLLARVGPRAVVRRVTGALNS